MITGLVVDTGIHSMGWSVERAKAFMATHTAASAGNIDAEVKASARVPDAAALDPAALPSGGAAEAGMEPWDLILAINGTKIEGLDDFRDELNLYRKMIWQ